MVGGSSRLAAHSVFRVIKAFTRGFVNLRSFSIMGRKRFIIDNDCGLDDAQAILMALSQPDVEVLGITTVKGNASVDQVCKNVLRVLKVANRLEIPVYKGTSDSLLRDSPTCTLYHGKDGLGDVPDPNPPDLSLIRKEHAVSALVRMVNENPGEISLICLGPLTNVAMAIQMDPELGSKLKDCHIMGGNYEAKGNITVCGEFNFRADPEAAYIVLNQLGCSITLVCWELCLKHSLTWDFYNGLVGNKTAVAAFIKLCEEKTTTYLRGKSLNYLCCDQFSVVGAVDSGLFTDSLECYATVELLGQCTRGQLVVDERGLFEKNKNVKIIKRMDVAKFCRYLERIVHFFEQ